MQLNDLCKPERVPETRILVDAKGVCHRVVYTVSGIMLLEAAGLFPRHFHISKARIAWYLDEILHWMQSRVDARADFMGSGKDTEITEADRFIDFWETSTRVLLTPRGIYKLERAGAFPRRISLGPRRVAYLEREVVRWIGLRAAQRGAGSSSPP